jgi:hypothetical protein
VSRRDAERLEDILAAADAIVADTVTVDLPPLVEATRRLLAGLATRDGLDRPQPD